MVWDLYGTKSEDYEDLRIRTEAALGINFVLHNSFHFGGDYLLAYDAEGGQLTIRANHYPDGKEDYVVEEDYPAYRLLLTVEGSKRLEEIRRLLSPICGLDYLRRS